MIVENKEKTIEKANDITSKLIKLINEESANFVMNDDPAEQIYLVCHTIGVLLAKIAITLESYGKVYAIPNLGTTIVKEWINIIADENIRLNEKNYG